MSFGFPPDAGRVSAACAEKRTTASIKHRQSVTKTTHPKLLQVGGNAAFTWPHSTCYTALYSRSDTKRFQKSRMRVASIVACIRHGSTETRTTAAFWNADAADQQTAAPARRSATAAVHRPSSGSPRAVSAIDLLVDGRPFFPRAIHTRANRSGGWRVSALVGVCRTYGSQSRARQAIIVSSCADDDRPHASGSCLRRCLLRRGSPVLPKRPLRFKPPSQRAPIRNVLSGVPCRMKTDTSGDPSWTLALPSLASARHQSSRQTHRPPHDWFRREHHDDPSVTRRSTGTEPRRIRTSQLQSLLPRACVKDVDASRGIGLAMRQGGYRRVPPSMATQWPKPMGWLASAAVSLIIWRPLRTSKMWADSAIAPGHQHVQSPHMEKSMGQNSRQMTARLACQQHARNDHHGVRPAAAL